MSNSNTNIENQPFYQFITECINLSSCKNYIFRGTSRAHVETSGRIDSSLYRYLLKSQPSEFKLSIFGAEQETVENAKYLFPPNSKNIEILTELRHYGENLAIIDFSRNLYVALFFACQRTLDNQGKVSKDPGEIILLEIADTSHKPNPEANVDVDYNAKNFYAIEPAANHSSLKRVMAQNSIFIHAPQGYIDSNNQDWSVISLRVKFEHKRKILKYLDKYHGINAKTMFRDVIGFIENNKQTNSSDYQMGTYANRIGKYDEAIQYLSNAIEDNPNLYMAFIRRGIAFYGLNQFSESINDCSRAIDIDPQNDIAYVNRGNARYRIGKMNDALSDLNKAIEINSASAGSYLFRGGIHIYMSNFKNALEDANNALKIDSTLADALQLRHIANLALDNNEDANKDLEKLTSTQPKKISTYLAQGLKYMSQKKYLEAINEYNNVLDLDPKNVQAYMQIGMAKCDMGMYKAAINDFSFAVEILSPFKETRSLSLSAALYHLGLAKIQCNDFMSGISDLTKALQSSHEDPYALNHRGLAYYAVGKGMESQNNMDEANQNFNYALEDFNLAIKIKPDFKDAYYNRSLVHKALGNHDEAEKDLNEFNRLNTELPPNGEPK